MIGKLGSNLAEVLHEFLQVLQREREHVVEGYARVDALLRLDVALEVEVV